MTSGGVRPVCVILSGGAGRRIGGRKAFVELGGRPLIAHVRDRIEPQTAQLAVNVASMDDPELLAFGLPVLVDTLPGCGPLGGILTALDWAHGLGEDRVMTVAVDTPFLPRDVVERLSTVGAPVVYARTKDGPHATTAIWSVDLRSDLQSALEGGVRKVRDWAGSVGATGVMFEDASAFLNVNTPEDLHRAEAMLAG